MDKRPIVAIVIKDPFGPEPGIICRVLADRSLYDIIRPVVVADHWCMFEAASRWNAEAGLKSPMEAVEHGLRALKGRCPANGAYRGGMIDVIDMKVTKKADEKTPELVREAALRYKEHAEAMWLAGELDAFIFCPDSPEELKALLDDAKDITPLPTRDFDDEE